MTRLNLGCGRHPLEGWINLDSVALPGVDMVHDLEKCAEKPLPLSDNSITEFFASHVIEHITNILPMMEECWRIARPKAIFTIRCPHGASDDAFEDPTHVRMLFLQSFGYFSQPYYWRADYGYRGDWQPTELILFVGKEHGWMPQEALLEKINKERNIVREMVCVLTAIKPARLPQRELQALPVIRIARVANG